MRVGAFIDWCISRTAKLPTTNLRITWTLALVVATGVVYLVLAVKLAMLGTGRAWEPSASWLTFLVVMSGLDAATFTAKRLTHKGDGPSSEGG